MSILSGLFAACGWVMLADKDQHTVVVFFTVWAFSALASYCVLPHNDEE